MNYFMISQKENIPNIVNLHIRANSPDEPQTEFSKAQKDQLNQVTAIPVSGDENAIYPAVFDRPVFIVSDELRRVIEFYDDTVLWKCVPLMDYKMERQETYWLPLIDKIDYLSDETEFYGDGSLKKLVLDKEKIGTQRIFRVNTIREKIVVVNLDIAESILRRSFAGVQLEAVLLKGGQELCPISKLR
jgi:hypothetical protein